MLKSYSKKVISIVLTLSMVMSMVAITPISTSAATKIPSNWAAEAIVTAKNQGLATPELLNDFSAATTRIEFCRAVINMLRKYGYDVDSVTPKMFSDTNDIDIGIAAALGITSGTDFVKNTFTPNGKLTREQAAALLNNVLSVINVGTDKRETNSEVAWTDISSISGWALYSVNSMYNCGVMSGTSTTKLVFSPKAEYSHEQSIATLLRMWTFINANEYFDNSDSDFDGLTDDDEINLYGTNPNNADTDGDGADDGLEVYYGTNPLAADYSFYQTQTTGEVDQYTPVAASVYMDLQGEQVGTLEVKPVSMADEVLLSPLVPGYLGCAFDFSVEGEFNDATITFEYDTSLGVICDEFQPRIYYFDEETGVLEELPGQTVSNGYITASVSHFSKYILLNSVDYNLAWATEIRKPVISSSTGTQEQRDLDVVFVIDESSSMEANSKGTNNDPNRLRIDAAKGFVEQMGYNDRAAIIGFSSDSRMLLSLEYDKYVINTQIDNILGNRGGTQLYLGLEAAIEELIYNSRHNADKVIIALTDGEDDPSAPSGSYDNVIESANALGITIFTVGLGSSINKTLLATLAESTAGKYFHATAAEDLYDGLELVKDETVDYNKDSNGDGISDYFAKLIFDGTLRMSNGSAEFLGAEFATSDSNPDWDGDGLLNGEEIIVVELNGRVMARFLSDPTLPDSDMDGYRDDEDPHPFYSDYFSKDTSDFYTLTDDSRYMYSQEAQEYDDSFWKQMGDGTVTILSFTNMQKEYTEEMVNFFIQNANEEYVNKMAMAEIEAIIKENTFDDVKTYIDSGQKIIGSFVERFDKMNDITNEALRAASDVERIAAAQKVIEAKLKWMNAIEEGRSAKSVAGYKAWFTQRKNQQLLVHQKGVSTSATRAIKATKAAFEIVDSVLLAYNTYKVVEGAYDTWKVAENIAKLNAQNELFTQNEELFIHLRDNAEHRFTRGAAAFVLNSMYESYGAVIAQIAYENSLPAAGLAIDVLLAVGFITGPAGVIIGIGLAVFAIFDTALGWSDNAKTRGRIICLDDMSEAATMLVNRYFLVEEKINKLGQNLEILVNLRVVGENRFCELYNNRGSRCSIARENASVARSIANKMGLFVRE